MSYLNRRFRLFDRETARITIRGWLMIFSFFPSFFSYFAARKCEFLTLDSPTAFLDLGTIQVTKFLALSYLPEAPNYSCGARCRRHIRTTAHVGRKSCKHLLQSIV